MYLGLSGQPGREYRSYGEVFGTPCRRRAPKAWNNFPLDRFGEKLTSKLPETNSTTTVDESTPPTARIVSTAPRHRSSASNFSEWFISHLAKDGKIIKELPRRDGEIWTPYTMRVPRCYYGGGDKEMIELGAIRKRWKTLHGSIPDRGRRQGKCPLSPEEVGLMLRALGEPIELRPGKGGFHKNLATCVCEDTEAKENGIGSQKTG